MSERWFFAQRRSWLLRGVQRALSPSDSQIPAQYLERGTLFILPTLCHSDVDSGVCGVATVWKEKLISADCWAPRGLP